MCFHKPKVAPNLHKKKEGGRCATALLKIRVANS